MAVRGDDPLKIQRRAGHSDFATTDGYIRLAEHVRVGFGEPFPDLSDLLMFFCDGSKTGSQIGSRMTQVPEILERETGFEPATPSLGSLCSTN